jgi:hypothetical protein
LSPIQIPTKCQRAEVNEAAVTSSHGVAIGGGTPCLIDDLVVKNEFSTVKEDLNENLLSKANSKTFLPKVASKTEAGCRWQAKKALSKHASKQDEMIDVTKNFFDRNKLYLKSAIQY